MADSNREGIRMTSVWSYMKKDYSGWFFGLGCIVFTITAIVIGDYYMVPVYVVLAAIWFFIMWKVAQQKVRRHEIDIIMASWFMNKQNDPNDS